MSLSTTVLEDLSPETIWVEKYRPRNLDELVAHEEIRGTLRKLISEHTLPHLLFYGPPGTGKTTAILACAREMYGAHFKSMVLELNASDDRGIDVVREQIKTFASTRQIFAQRADVKAYRSRRSRCNDLGRSSSAEKDHGTVYDQHKILSYLQLCE
ncbi:Replication factor C (RF-C) subunit [Cyanidiococcus yangmingshanensis]|uniref:Replication factor C (RF-C) subunit n=1 Tax=Cyanidiococcus yangmingshanensis TaxID=2690220 RepID=A0A7J7IPD9_9RHOD|nr:Replication factor C (RF-C) subunit [Cyanidiococcus yangmingshanensis]